MPRLLTRFYPIIFTAGFLGILFGNAAAWHNPLVGGVLLAAALCTFGTWTGRWAAPRERGAIQAWVGTWIILSAIMLAGAACYYAASFTAPAALVLAGLMGPVAWGLSRRARASLLERPHDLLSEKRHAVPGRVWLAATLVVAGLVAAAWMISGGATTEAVRSAWANVPPGAFVAFGVAVFLLYALLLRGRERAASIPLVCATIALFLLVAALVFPLGFGFDPFIHQATEEHIAKFGTISPKPFYYIGQYALVLFAHHAFALPVESVNALLVPILAALLLPIAWYSAAAHLLREKSAAAATLMALPLVPLSSFVLTTPQGLANLWTLLLVLAAVPTLVRDERPRVWPLALPAVAAAATHPIAGLPAVLFVILLAADPARNGNRFLSRLVFWSGAIVGSVLLPLSFVANSLLSTGTLGLSFSDINLLNLLDNLSLFLANRFNPLLDFVYLYGLNAVPVFLALAAAGWWISRKPMHGALRVLLLMAGMLAVNWFLLSTAVDFSFLIDYERQNFAARLVPIALFFLVPFVILAIGAWTSRVRPAPASVRVATVALFAALTVSALYLAYPRNDAYVAGHGYNVSLTDIQAVHDIETDANGTPYVVLANQTVSAAAVRELGFVRYWGDLFFYPIPTGGDLYARFLEMNDRPNRETAQAAANLVNARCVADPGCTQAEAQTVYYVVNDYWWEAPRIVETAKQNADVWWALDGGAVHVFKYSIAD